MEEIIWLYLASKRGDKVQQWGIQNLGNGNFITHEGFTGGKISVSEPTFCEPKNVGKANETSKERQCELEIVSKIKKKRDKGYSLDPEKIERPFVPTLAHVYEDHVKKIKFPGFASPKLDGMRCVVRKTGMFSRAGKPIVSAPHIFESFKDYFEVSPDAIFDGELYADKGICNFNEIMSLVKKTKPTQGDLDLSREKIEFRLFDIVSDSPYSDRWDFCIPFGALSYIEVVPSIFVEKEEELFHIHKQFVEQGYEGTMFRWGNDGYICERTDKLLKIKDFFEKEYKVKRVESGRGKRANTVAKWVLETETEKEFEVGPSGTDEENARWWLIRDTLPNEWATITFQELTPDGVPRFGVFKAIRDKSEILP